MKTIVSLIIVCLLSVLGLSTQNPATEKHVRQAVESFYAAFNAHGFERAAEYTTEDWNHINPLGGRTRGRDATLQDLKEVHSSFLKGVTDTIEDMDVRFASPDVAVVTVNSQMSTFVTPDKVRHENERHIRTFVVVKRNGRWLIMQDQNTTISS
ncbi:MAG TPA: SgcJ/EcaC family oxidoreductase [Pyrinomonadaceae bacterium]|nr:SgcJ/EcaC family oxidoreductase [Pyrinomonadaceae bacterium]